MSKLLEIPAVGLEKNKKEIPAVLKNFFEKYVDDITGEMGLLNRYIDLLQGGAPHWREKYNREKLLITLQLAEDFLIDHQNDLDLLSKINEFLDFDKDHKLAPGEIFLVLEELGYVDKIRIIENEKINSSAEDRKTRK